MNLIYSNPRFQAWDKDNSFLAFGRLWIYDAGTLDLKTIYDSEGVELANPQILNELGKVAVNGIYADVGDYKLVYERRDDIGSYSEVDVVDNIPNSTVSPSFGSTSLINTIADLRLLSEPTEDTSVYVSEYYTDYFKGGGVFVWDSTSTATDDNGSVIQPSSLPVVGRWIRSFENTDINPHMWGCVSDDIAFDNQTRMAQMFLFGSSNSEYRIVLPKGIWYCSGNLTVNSSFKAEYGAIIDKSTLGNYTFTFGESSVIDIPINSLFLGGEGYKYQLVIDDNATSNQNLVSFSWVAKDCNTVSNNNLSLTTFLSTVNNFLGGIAVNKYHLVNDNSVNLEGKTIVLQNGGKLLVDLPASMVLPDKIVDERSNQLLGGIGGEFTHQNVSKKYQLSCFLRDGTTLFCLLSDSKTIPSGTEIEVDYDYSYIGSLEVTTNRNITIIPNGGILSNATTNYLYIDSQVSKVPIRWLDSLSLQYIIFYSGDILMSWFWSEGTGLLPNALNYIARFGLEIDLDGCTYDMGTSSYTISDGNLSLKNGKIIFNDNLIISDAKNILFKDLYIENFQKTITIIPSTISRFNLEIENTRIYADACDINAQSNFEIRKFKINNFEAECDFNFSTQVYPINDTDITVFFTGDNNRYIKNSNFQKSTSFETMTNISFEHNTFSNTQWITCRYIKVIDCKSQDGIWTVGGGIQNIGDLWKLNGVSFIDNSFFEDTNYSSFQPTGIFPNDYVEIRSNSIDSIFKGNKCLKNSYHGIANNEIEYKKDVIGLTLPKDADSWEMEDSGLDSSISSSGSILIHELPCKKNESHFLCFGRANISANLYGCIEKNLIVQGSMYFRESVPVSSSNWTLGESAITSTGDKFFAPYWHSGDFVKMYQWPSFDDDGIDIGYSPKISYQIWGAANSSDPLLTSACQVKYTISGTIKV